MAANRRYAVPMFSLKALSFLALLAIEMPFAAAGANPAKMAGRARFDLSSTNVNLTGALVLTGSGQIERMGWVQGEAKNRGYTANFSISHYGWSELSIRFTPTADGIVELKLMGPYDAAPGGELYQEEVLWDKLTAQGTTLQNGSFEENSKGWSGALIETGKAVLDGKSYGRTWHNRALTTTFAVTRGEPVTLTLFARAQIPEGFHEMRQLSANSRGFTAAKRFRRGANLGNYLEAPPNQDWGMHYAREDFVNIKKEGFDHVRIPVGWHHYSSGAPEFKLTPEIFGKVDFLVTNALAEGLNVIVNIHHFDAFTSDPEPHRGRFDALWEQIAAHYQSAPDAVAFELLNEPKDKATTTVLNPIFTETIRLIRRSNPSRTIFLGPSKWNSIEELPSLQLPDDDENLIVTVHCYDPFYFTHQGATWSGPDTATRGIVFPGPPQKPLVPDLSLKLKAGVLDWIRRYNSEPTENNPSSAKAFRPKLQRAKEWSAYYGRPIHVGEFGAYVGADAESRANFYREFRKVLDELDLGWAMWDWKAGFKYWDEKANGPAPGMHEALFGAKRR